MMIRQQAKSKRSGFTLIEILVVISIIGIIASLLLAALLRSSERKNDADRFQELQMLAKALDLFKDRYGVYPPSRLILIENGDYSPTNLTNLFAGVPAAQRPERVEVAQRSAHYLKTVFRLIRLRLRDSDPFLPAGTGYDFNGDNDANDAFEIFGDQCLVFFLSGYPNPALSSTQVALQGFVKSGWNPCPIDLTDSFSNQRERVVNLADSFSKSATARFDWQACRVYPANTMSGNVVMPVILDPDAPADTSTARENQPSIFYFSAYDGAGYQPNDGGGFNGGRNRPGPPAWGASFRLTPSGASTFSWGPNPYTIGPSNPAVGGIVKFHKPNTFQLIAPGPDGNYGVGGALPADGSEGSELSSNDIATGGGDNMTNLATKRLRNIRELDVDTN